jgi:glycosyltransferase involved in cell wall biosynthesis
VARLYRLAVAGLAVLRRLPLFEGARPSKLFPIMASALPVLYSGAGEGARLVTGAGAGLAAPPEDPEALAQALLQLLQDPEAARAMGRSGRAYAEAHLAWPRLVGDWLDQVARAGVNIR